MVFDTLESRTSVNYHSRFKFLFFLSIYVGKIKLNIKQNPKVYVHTSVLYQDREFNAEKNLGS